MRWLLDDGPLGHLAGVVDSLRTESWQTGRLLVPRSAAIAQSERSTRTRTLLSRVDEAGSRVIEQISVRLASDDPAASILLELHGDTTSSTDLAEREAIAWALAHGDDAVLVAMDRRAALTALAELGVGRVGHPFDVWLDLLDRRWIDSEVFSRLCRLTKKHDQGLERMPGRVASRL